MYIYIYINLYSPNRGRHNRDRDGHRHSKDSKIKCQKLEFPGAVVKYELSSKIPFFTTNQNSIFQNSNGSDLGKMKMRSIQKN